MIVFDLRCTGAHVFEAWFGSSADYESQQARGLIACPMCGDTGIAKAVMAPAIAAKSNRGEMSVANTPTQAPPHAELLAMQRRMEANSDYVGGDFAAVARAVHDGSAPERCVHGEASAEDVRALIDDGIGILPLPFRPLARFDA